MSIRPTPSSCPPRRWGAGCAAGRASMLWPSRRSLSSRPPGRELASVSEHKSLITILSPSPCRMKPIMKSLRIVFRLGLLIGLGIAIPGLPATAQTTSPKEAQPPAPGLQKLTGADARRAEELDKAIEAALKADRWDEAIATARRTARLADAGPGAEALRDGETRSGVSRRCAGWPRCRTRIESPTNRPRP